jgi:hypothetical protein
MDGANLQANLQLFRASLKWLTQASVPSLGSFKLKQTRHP